MNGGQLIAEVLERQGVRFLFTLCGGHISPILAGCKQRGIRVVDVRDEANAVFAADAVARMTGIPGVAAVTAGPGVTNTLTALPHLPCPHVDREMLMRMSQVAIAGNFGGGRDKKVDLDFDPHEHLKPLVEAGERQAADPDGGAGRTFHDGSVGSGRRDRLSVPAGPDRR